ncbi:Serine/threonine-protein kinase SKY1 [Tolypocladium ophioglossoides CBS 100239]|uniref:EKC/KEOPS complex subunit BUD32 n=1 Tax=Tolypocladium ophioglossoides (strain CBS 100239) TaxID=1163406 RepID=A0A0L0N0B8_TOLOC|nr:Serine/threonine-protein kinase SKY1 [Tolypocladium ophioglossoides CBS 100239]
MPANSLGASQRWNSLVLRGYEEYLEKARSYRSGGYHPVHLDDCLHDGRYRVIHKLGYGGYSTVWLCQDTHHHTPKYVAVKILIARQSKTECRELLLLRRIREMAIDKKPGGEHICLPLDHFRLTGPNGTHICIVYSVLGPDLGSAMDIFSEDLEPDECARDIRRLSQQVTKGLAILHDHGICHGDLRPSNILLQLKTLDGLDKEEVYDLLGEPETAEILLHSAPGEPVVVPEIPRYLVYPVDFYSVETSYILKHIFITDFGQSFDTSLERVRLSGIPRSYCAPEMVFDKAAGIAGDLWSLGCLLFEVRLSDKIVNPNDLLGPNNEEYILSVSVILGKLPEPWWSSWERRDWFFEPTEQEVHSLVFERPGRLAKNTPENVDAPKSIKGKIMASCYRWTHQGGYEKYQDVPEDEVKLMADLLGKLLRYVPEQRISAREVVHHEWFRV